MARTTENLSTVKVKNTLCNVISFIYQIRINCQTEKSRQKARGEGMFPSNYLKKNVKHFKDKNIC